ncbi:hypothetical protein [Metasolibacillus meyeri]|uniref:hypothetical protein n=1 Tax=Metasolibacillus meyeri TaxID=1071052 RepID=UPI000D30D8CA|nr:hypothetical protein [Metasolibacillus meyeri]
MYCQLNKNDEGIPAHFHPSGEDSAIVLQGELTYDVSFEQQLKAVENDIVFGWTNYVHGYHNSSLTALHILIFATPEHNESIYDPAYLPKGEYPSIRLAKMTSDMMKITSERMIFSTKQRNIAQHNMMIFDCYKKELQIMEHHDQPASIQPNSIVIQFKDNANM